MSNEVRITVGKTYVSHKKDSTHEGCIVMFPGTFVQFYDANDYKATSTTIAVNLPRFEGMEISPVDGSPILKFVGENGETVQVQLRTITPEQLCDAVEAARLQEIEA